MVKRHAPFGTIESATEFLSLLSEQIDEAMAEVRVELAACADSPPARRVEAWQVVLHTLTRLSLQISESRRLTNNLRTLRNLMYRTGDLEGDLTGRSAVSLSNSHD